VSSGIILERLCHNVVIIVPTALSYISVILQSRKILVFGIIYRLHDAEVSSCGDHKLKH